MIRRHWRKAVLVSAWAAFLIALDQGMSWSMGVHGHSIRESFAFLGRASVVMSIFYLITFSLASIVDWATRRRP